MGGGNTFRTLHTPAFGLGNGTERANILGSAVKADAIARVATKPFPAQAGFGTKLLDAPQFASSARLAGRRQSRQPDNFFDYAVQLGDVVPQDGKSAYELVREAKRKNGNGASHVAKSEFHGKHTDLSPPMDAKQLSSLAEFYYLDWLARAHPEDHEAVMKRRTYTPGTIDTLVSFGGKAEMQGPRAKKFFSDAKKAAFRMAQDMIKARKEMDVQLSEFRAEMESNVTQLVEKQSRELAAIEESFKNRREVVNAWTETKLVKEVFLKYGPIIGTGIAACSKWLNGLLKGVPIISEVPIEVLGLGAIVLWALAKIHLAMVKIRLPQKEAGKKAHAIEMIRRETDEHREIFGKRKVWLEEECEKKQREVLKGVSVAFRNLEATHGYPSPN